MKKFEKIVIIALLLILVPYLAYNLYLTQTKYLLILFASIIIFALWKVIFPKISTITKLLLTIGIVVVYTFAYDACNMLNPYPIIVTTDNPDVERELQDFIKMNSPAIQEIRLQGNIYYTTLHTNNRKIYDKLAIKIAQNPSFQYRVNIGMFFKHSNNPKTQKRRIEKALKNRIKLMKNVKSVKCHLEYTEENSKANWQDAKLYLDVVVNKKADRSELYTVIDNFLPVPDDNKDIKITQK
ncbi:hypothetical protein IJ596_01995 [bacterium]|nr:hypothetical protein [bacterium]